jgi:hypothetical protein
VVLDAETQLASGAGAVIAAQRDTGQPFATEPAVGEEEALALEDALSIVDRVLPVRARPGRQGSPSQEDSPEHPYDPNLTEVNSLEQATLIEGLAKRSRRGIQRIGALTRLPAEDLEALRTEGSLPNHAWDRLAEIALNEVLSSADAPEPTA